MSSNLPAFIAVQGSQQLHELHDYLKKAGVDLNEFEEGEDGCLVNLKNVIGATEQCFKHIKSDGDIECVMNSVVTQLTLVQYDESGELIESFCEKVASDTDSKILPRMHILYNLFSGLDEHSIHRATVYLHLLQLATAGKQLAIIPHELKQVKDWITAWEVPQEKAQQIYRNLYDLLDLQEKREEAAAVMFELLSAYTDETCASDIARKDATRCIRDHIVDSETFIFDHLLPLKPIKCLEDQPLHQLLLIFIQGRLGDYNKFLESNRDLIDSLDLNQEQCLYKLRLLTLIQMASTQPELSFEELEKQLELNSDEVEIFVIEAVRSKVLQAKIDQMGRRVYVAVTLQRSFTTDQWVALKDRLVLWHKNLADVRNNIHSLFMQQ